MGHVIVHVSLCATHVVHEAWLLETNIYRTFRMQELGSLVNCLVSVAKSVDGDVE